MTDYGFKGWDYTELIKYVSNSPDFHWEISSHLDIDTEDEPVVEDFKSWITNHFDWCHETDEFKKLIEVCKAYLAVLAEQADKITYSGPLWRGLAQIEDGYTFMSYFIQLFEGMWT